MNHRNFYERAEFSIGLNPPPLVEDPERFYGSGERKNSRLASVHPEMVDFGSEQGLSVFATAGIVNYSEDFKKAKTHLWAERCH